MSVTIFPSYALISTLHTPGDTQWKMTQTRNRILKVLSCHIFLIFCFLLSDTVLIA